MSFYTGISYGGYLTTDGLRALRNYQREFRTEKVISDRARIITWEGAPTLLSYRTKVAKIVDGKLVRLWDGWSVTTASHIYSFCSEYGLRAPSKKEWLAMPIGE